MSDDATPRLLLPYLAAGQAQKHITLNEALALLDGLVQMAAESRATDAQPGGPAEGELWIMTASASGADWGGKAEGAVMRFEAGVWDELEVPEGTIAWVKDEDLAVVWDGAAWAELVQPPTELQNLDLLGVNATADAANKLSVASDAVLFSHDGDDARVKVNKAAAGDTASHLFQTGYSGRAEFGLIGNDDFTIKVSPDGSTWVTAFAIDKTTGRATGANMNLTTLVVGGAGAITSGYGVEIDNASLLVKRADTSPAEFYAVGDGGTARFKLETYIASSTSVSGQFDKMRGSLASPAVANTNDVLGSFFFGTWNSSTSAVIQVGQFGMTLIDPSPGPTSLGVQYFVNVAATGSSTRTSLIAADHTNGFSLRGSVVMNADRLFMLRNYTVATLPSAATAGSGATAFVTDASAPTWGATVAGSGAVKVPVYSDGTNWKVG